MSQHPVAELRAAEARSSAIRQYERAERKHRDAGNELMVGGWFGLAGESFIIADFLGAAALDERTCAPLRGKA